MQFYPADWRKDLAVQALDYFERGVWFEILCLMHESSERGVLLLNGNPMPEDVLARLLGLDKQILTTSLTKLLTYGVAKRRPSDLAIFNKRMVDDEKLCQVRREAGKLGGNPTLLKQKPTTRLKQNPTPSSSSSSSFSNSEACAILTYLNELSGRNYQAVKANLSLIESRLKEGFSSGQCKAVIDAKWRAWKSDTKMSAFLRPKTLFNATNFAQYAGELEGKTTEVQIWE